MGVHARIETQIAEGTELLKTARDRSNAIRTESYVDTSLFISWQARSLSLLVSYLPASQEYEKAFRAEVSPLANGVKAGINLLKAMLQDANDGTIAEVVVPQSPVGALELITNRFHQVAKQLRSRHDNRPTLDVSDEYDCQDLLHSLLRLYFDDIRTEEWTPSHAGKCSRMDFLLKREQIVIEIKKTRKGLDARVLGTQLIEDIERYRVHPDCKRLICFVYDPEGMLGNPHGIENDLRRLEPLPVDVWIKPM